MTFIRADYFHVFADAHIFGCTYDSLQCDGGIVLRWHGMQARCRWVLLEHVLKRSITSSLSIAHVKSMSFDMSHSSDSGRRKKHEMTRYPQNSAHHIMQQFFGVVEQLFFPAPHTGHAQCL